MLLAAAELDLVGLTIGLCGGLALFLYGMHELSDGLQAAAGERMKALLGKVTSNRFVAALTGAIVTAVIQSSSVTTVLVVGFVSAGLMSLTQSVGVIMGANVGTTITAQLVAFQVTQLAWLMVAVGFALASLSRRDQFRHSGTMLLGLGLLFLGLDQMSSATSPLQTYPLFLQLLRTLNHPVSGILIGAVFTALVQSSSATTGVVVMLASQGFLSLEAGIALAIGANIGTCVTAVVAAIGKPVDAVRVAVVHVLFNVLGALLWVGFIDQLADLARQISPAAVELQGIQRAAAETPRQIANANTLFNVVNTCVLIGFAGPLAALANRLVPARAVTEPVVVQPRFLDPVYLRTPVLALDRVLLEVEHLGEHVVLMLEAALPSVLRGSRADLRRVAAMDDDVDRLYLAILDFLHKLGREELTTPESQRLQQLLAAANYLEATGDLIETNLVAQGLRRIDARLTCSPQTVAEMRPLERAVIDATRQALQALTTGDQELAQAVVTSKERVHRQADQLMDHLAQRLLADEPHRATLFGIESDIVGQLKRLYYNARRMAKLVIDATPPVPADSKADA